MEYPGFQHGKLGVLFFSRGRGRGHAVPDIEIARALMELRPDVDLRFVSYATGARAIQETEFPLIDLGLPAQNPLTLTLVLAAKLMGWLQPALVIAHEEFPALPAAKIFDRPTVFLTDWFLDEQHYTTQTMQFADRVLFLDEEGSYSEPHCLRGKVEYLGVFQRGFTYSRADRERAREELGIPAEAFVVSVLPGSYATEAQASLADLLLPAFDLLDQHEKHLVWVAGTDEDLLRERTASNPRIQVLPYEPQIDRVMVASDVAVTKANRKTVLELEGLGIPQVAICYGQNPIDEQRLRRVRGAVALQPTDCTPTALARLLAMQASAGPLPGAQKRVSQAREIALVVAKSIHAG
ncbi:MAG: hypothetical protein KIT83_08710 [Bryobacterales bacterium]|nr:hypothetical protein [Bryobacterales bacterium]